MAGRDLSKPFWEMKTFEDMTTLEWESLCDGCARCCLYKLQDEDTGEYFYTNVVCRLLNLETCRCTAYTERTILMPTCLALTPELVRSLDWLPTSCAYRLLAEGKPLPEWHPLVSGNAGTVHAAGISVMGKTLSEEDVDMDNLEEYIVSSDD